MTSKCFFKEESILVKFFKVTVLRLSKYNGGKIKFKLLLKLITIFSAEPHQFPGHIFNIIQRPDIFFLDSVNDS